jgi:hypothetical protein
MFGLNSFMPGYTSYGPPPWSTPPIFPTPNGRPNPVPLPGGPPPIYPTSTTTRQQQPNPNQPLIPTYGKNMPRWLQKLSGGFNNVMGRMAGPDDPNLSPQENDARKQHAQMAMIGQILQGAAPRPKGTGSPLADFGSAMMAGQQASGAFSADAMRAKLMQAQMAQAQQGGQERADPNVIRALVMAGIDPKSPQGQEIVIKSLTGGNDQLEAIQAQLAIDQRRDQLARDRAADEQKTAEANRARVQMGNTLRRSINQTADIASLTEKLEGSFLEAGMPASSWRRTGASLLAGAGSALGMDTGKLETDLVNFDKLKKGMSDQLNNLVSTGSLGQVTNDKLQSFRDALANTETSPGAVMSIQAGIAEALLEEADAQGVEVENRSQVEANIKRWRAYEPSTDEQAPVPIESLLDKYAPIER